MKKSGKFLFVSILMIMFIFAFSTIVKADDEIDYSGYEELGTDAEEEATEQPAETQEQPAQPAQTTQEEEKQPAQEPEKQQEPVQQPAQTTTQEEKKTTTNTVNSTNKTNTSTESHAKAGEFKTTIYTIGAGVFGAVLAIGYTKLKKYIF